MSTLTPPVQLEHPENQFRVDYMQDVASQHNFEYTTVSNILKNICQSNFILGIKTIFIYIQIYKL